MRLHWNIQNRRVFLTPVPGHTWWSLLTWSPRSCRSTRPGRWSSPPPSPPWPRSSSWGEEDWWRRLLLFILQILANSPNSEHEALAFKVYIETGDSENIGPIPSLFIQKPMRWKTQESCWLCEVCRFFQNIPFLRSNYFTTGAPPFQQWILIFLMSRDNTKQKKTFKIWIQF